MSEKYTKEAWFIENVGEEPLHVTSASRDGFIPVCIVQTGYEGQIEVEQQANARRIVACVNALEHISTEDLESGRMQNLAVRLADAEKQRDELLAFAKEFVEAWGNGMAGDSYLLKMANAAILKATGEQA